MQRALTQSGSWLAGSGIAPEQIAPKASNAGRKPEAERWKSFYFAVIELAKDGRLTADQFPSATSLCDEVLEIMGGGAFSADHVKATIGQIYKKFVAAN